MASSETAADPAESWYCPGCERAYPTPLGACPADGSRLVRVSERDPFLGQVLDHRFVIRERLGAGGMGVVYRAWQTSVGREVAVKVIRARAGSNVALVKRFLREAKLSSQLSQPATVSVIDFGQTDDGVLYLVMELLRGRTLAAVIADGPLAPERAVRIAVQICDALDAAHGAGIIHRDLKPANVMILDEPAGRDLTKVLDFGLAKAIDSDESSVTQSGRLVGTPTHLAPEVATGGAATPASDLYALGVMLYEMLAGAAPFSADEVSTVIMMHAYHTAPALAAPVPPALAALVARVLAKRPGDRPATAAALRGLLEAAIQAPGAGAVDPGVRAASTGPVGIDDTRDLATALTRSSSDVPPAAREPGRAVADDDGGKGAAGVVGRRRRVLLVAAMAAVIGGTAFVLTRDRPRGAGSAPAVAPAPSAAIAEDAAIDGAATIDGAAMIDAPGALDVATAVDAGVLDAGRGRARPIDASARSLRPIDAGGSAPPVDAGVPTRAIDAGRPPMIDSGTGWLDN